MCFFKLLLLTMALALTPKPPRTSGHGISALGQTNHERLTMIWALCVTVPAEVHVEVFWGRDLI